MKELTSHFHGRRKDIVQRLAEIDVVIRVHQPCFAPRPAKQFGSCAKSMLLFCRPLNPQYDDGTYRSNPAHQGSSFPVLALLMFPGALTGGDYCFGADKIAPLFARCVWINSSARCTSVKRGRKKRLCRHVGSTVMENYRRLNRSYPRYRPNRLLVRVKPHPFLEVVKIIAVVASPQSGDAFVHRVLRLLRRKKTGLAAGLQRRLSTS